MCVIAIAAEGKRPSAKLVRQMWERNKDMGGIAWREPAEDGDGIEVVWEKGLSLDEMLDKCASLPLPYVAHFRIASVNGGGVRKEFCHPFPISPGVEMWLTGRTKGQVLFQNGDWPEWKREVWNASLRSDTPPLPKGKMNDTRGIAYLAYIMGTSVMDMIDQKGVAFGPDSLECFGGKDGWRNVGGIYCSNDKFCFVNNGNTALYGMGYNAQNHNSANLGADVRCKFGAGTNEQCSAMYATYEGYCYTHRHNRAVKFKFMGDGTWECLECHMISKGAENKHWAWCEYRTKSSPDIQESQADTAVDVQKEEEDGASKTGNVFCSFCRALLAARRGTKLDYCGGHKDNCPAKEFGTALERPKHFKEGDGGAPPVNPFRIVMLARSWHNQTKPDGTKVIGKKKLKKIEGRWGKRLQQTAPSESIN